LYFAAGFSFAPWGALYAALAIRGWDSPVPVLILLVGALSTGLFVWHRLEREQRVRELALLAQSFHIEARFWWLTEEYPHVDPASVKIVYASPRIATTRGRVIEVTSVARPALRRAHGWTVVTQT